MKPTLGVCYYPEHWPKKDWPKDAERMLASGIRWVRIGEFAWSRLEPKPGEFQWQWLDEAIAVLGDAGLNIILGTPTATPPRWMLDRYPDMLALDEQNNVRKFGSRRHYCFSHEAYKAAAANMAKIMAERYGSNEYVKAWQVDNEYGCHDTTLSYSVAAQEAFQQWLQKKYDSIDTLNEAWGNIFWSMDYDRFDQIELPNLTVTEPNPAHVLDFRRFSSDQVVAFNRAQVEVIRPYTQAPLIHNYMGRITEFDHYQVGADLDIASWDSYPLGFLEDRCDADEQWQCDFARQGDPDFQAFHHDLYRAVGNGQWWVMEQQPGPVNWAPFNPAPLPGMVRLWTWEAIAHGAQAVCYFRWRQLPFAQEQMHTGLLLPNSESLSLHEAEQVFQELEDFSDIELAPADIALVFDYESCWAWETQPQGETFNYFSLVFDFYRALRQLGLSIDIISPNTQSLHDYKAVVVPGLFTWDSTLSAALENYQGKVLLGPRTGSKTENFSIPESLPPNTPLIDCQVTYVESLRPDAKRSLKTDGQFIKWCEALNEKKIEDNAAIEVVEQLSDGTSALIKQGDIYYLAGWPDEVVFERVLTHLCDAARIKMQKIPKGLRTRETKAHRFIFNYSNAPVEYSGKIIPAAGVFWELKDAL